MSPQFSIILPSFNRAAMLRTALKTVLWQTLGDWECLVVDDGSTDETPAVLEEFKGDPRLRLLRNPRNEGMNAARNKALALAGGRLITFLDSDDLWLPSRLERFSARAARSPVAGFLFSNAYVWRFGRIIGTLFDPARCIPEGVVPGHYAIGDVHLPYVTTNVAIRREAFERHGLFRTEMKTLDTELFARLLAAGIAVAAISEPLSVRRLHGGQLTGRTLENFEEALIALGATGALPELIERRRQDVAKDVALYLIKAAEPAQARALIRRELGETRVTSWLFLAACLPAGALRGLRALRQLWLRLRHHPCWAGTQTREVARLIEPLLAAEEQAPKR